MHRTRAAIAIVTALGVSATLAPSVDAATSSERWESERASYRDDGTTAAFKAYGGVPDVAAGCRLVTFIAEDQTKPTDGVLRRDAYVYDRRTERSERVTAGLDPDRSMTTHQSVLSRTGRYVAFVSRESSSENYAPGDVYVLDRRTGATDLVTAVPGTDLAVGGVADRPSISDDGRYVAFTSTADGLVPEDTNGRADAFMHDRVTGLNTLITVRADGTAPGGRTSGPTISGDGTRVAFASNIDGLDPSDADGKVNAFVRFLGRSKTRLVSVDHRGRPAGSKATEVAISNNGKLVVFTAAGRLEPRATVAARHAYLHRLGSGTTRLVSVSSKERAANASTRTISVSRNGRYVGFSSFATNLSHRDDDDWQDVFIRDRKAGVTRLASVDGKGHGFHNGSGASTVSDDGPCMALSTWSGVRVFERVR